MSLVLNELKEAGLRITSEHTPHVEIFLLKLYEKQPMEIIGHQLPAENSIELKDNSILPIRFDANLQVMHIVASL